MSGIGSSPCVCGHNRLSHEVETAPACVHDDCTCVAFVAAAPPVGQVVGPRPPAAGPGAVDELLARAKASGHKSIAALAERIEDQLGKLRDRLDAERERVAEQRRREAEQARARAEVDRLEAQLRAARERLRGGPPPSTFQARQRAGGGRGQVRLFGGGLRPILRRQAGVAHPSGPRPPQRRRHAAGEGRVTADG